MKEEKLQQIHPIPIEEEIKDSYLTYAMSVIVSRALPDVRDGLKPVNRRILYRMNEMGLRHNQPYKKGGRIVGDVMGMYHPHGDQAIYDALVRMAQPFSLQMPLVQGQGNFGSVDGDPPAAMRYTEARMSYPAEELLQDIKKDTVNFAPNYDDSLMEPQVLPTRIPNLLINGASGIAVGMATNLPPHNLSEVCNGVAALIDNPEMSIDEILNIIKGPDFPTAGIICGRSGYVMAARTGKGKVIIRGRYHIEEYKKGQEAIIFTEIPYQVNKANLVAKIDELRKTKRIEGISEVRDESDRKGIRISIELRRGVSQDVILNQLFVNTSLQNSFNIHNLALVNNRPKLCNLKELLQYFISHRQDVITRRSLFELNKAKEREHILLGLKIALENIDDVIEVIKKSKSTNEARVNLMSRFELSEIQSQAILDMRLQRLTSMEVQKILDELAEIQKQIAYFEDLLANPRKILNLVKEETEEINKKHGKGRVSEISRTEISNIDLEDLIEQEDMMVILSHKGFIKRLPVSEYKEQGRGGVGANTSTLRDEDYVEHMFIANTHSKIMFVTNLGKAYWLKVYQIPEGSRLAKGTHLKNVLELEEGEEITASVALDDFTDDTYLFMATQMGTVKRVATGQFRNAKTRGIFAILLDEGDSLKEAILTDGKKDVFLFLSKGKGLRIHESSVRVMGRKTRGVRGIRMNEGDTLVGVCIAEEDKKILLLSERGSRP